MNRAKREARRATDQAEYEASLERAQRATEEQLIAHASAGVLGTFLVAGIPGLITRANAQRKLEAREIPARPDRP